MRSHRFTMLAGMLLLSLATAGTASAQYGGGGGTGGSGGSGGSGSGGTNSTGYNYGLSTGAKVGIGVGAAAGVTAAALLIHHHHVVAAREHASLVGCTQSVLNGLSIKNETDNQTYILLSSGASLKPGERVELAGAKSSGNSENPAFHVREVVKDYGACGTFAAQQPSVLPAASVRSK